MSDHPFASIAVPELPGKPRSEGLTCILDKGLGPSQVADLVATAGEHVDVAKFGWATARLQPETVLREKLRLYAAGGVATCTGGTFLELAHVQGRVREFLDAAGELGFAMVEVSDGVDPMPAEDKLGLVREAKERGFRVFSEVGKKDPEDDARLSLEDRVEAVLRELDAGAERVILEGRESGTVGIYDRTGKPATELLHRIVERIGLDRLVFEAPRKDQQVWMIRTFGPRVNLGNVAPDEALPLATLRTGLRGDTFADIHLPGVEVHVALGPPGALEARARGGVVVVVDALRFSATIVTALGCGMRRVMPVRTPEECVGDVTAGERGGRKLPNVRHGNSPTELLREDYRGRELVITTTNGVECLLTAAGPRSRVLVGTTLNRTAVARLAVDVAQAEGLPVTLLLAGRNNRDAIEDSLAAGEILRAMGPVRLHGPSLPGTAALEAEFFAGDSGRNLVALGYAEDVRFCAGIDRYAVVPELRDGVLVAHQP